MKRFVDEFAKHRLAEIAEEYRMALALLYINKEDGYEERAKAMKDEQNARLDNVSSRVEQCKYGYISETEAVKLIALA